MHTATFLMIDAYDSTPEQNRQESYARHTILERQAFWFLSGNNRIETDCKKVNN